MLTMKNTIITDRRRFFIIALILFVGVLASILMYWITDQGPGVSPDSTKYIESARSLLAGNGFFVQGKAMLQFPPVYPLMIAMVGILNRGDILLAARFLAAIFFGINLVLFGLMVRACTKHSLAAIGCAILAFLFLPSAISIHSMAWSEPPFISFSMAAFFLLAYNIVRPNLSLLALASIMAGFAAATRYVGIVLIPTMALALLLLGNRSFKQRMRDIFIFTFLASLPLASWFIRNMVIAQSATDREFTFHPISLDHVKNLIVNIYDCALSISISGWMKAFNIGIAAALFLFVIVLLHRRMYIRHNAKSVRIVLPTLCILYFLTYVMFLFISISFFDAHTPVSERLLFPPFLSLTVAVFALAWSLSDHLGKNYLWYSFLSLVLFFITINANYVIPSAVDIYHNGTGYTSRNWQHSEIISYLSQSRGGRKIYSNGPDAIRFLTGKKVVFIPMKKFPYSLRLNENFNEEMSRMLRECREGEALIAYFNNITWRWYFPSIHEIESTGDVPVLSRVQDGIIYGTS